MFTLYQLHFPHHYFDDQIQGRIQDFKLGEGALNKIVPSEGRRENVWGISCEKSRFNEYKSDFSDKEINTVIARICNNVADFNDRNLEITERLFTSWTN